MGATEFASGIIQTFGWNAAVGMGNLAAAEQWSPTEHEDLATAPLMRLCGGFTHLIALYPGGHCVPIGRDDLPVYRGLYALIGVDIVDVAFGKDFFVALTSVGEVLTYGANECGQLGQSHINPVFAGPFALSTTALSGQSGSAAAGFNTADHVPTLVKVLHGRRVVRVSCGAHHCLALSDIGDVYAWGDGSCGQLGVDNVELQPTPRLVSSLHAAMREAARASAAPAHPAACEAPAAHDLAVPVGSDGHVTVIKKFRAETEDAKRARMRSDAVVDVCSGAYFSAALTAHGFVYTWGEGRSYQLGTGRCCKKSLPQCVDFSSEMHSNGISIRMIAAGNAHVVALSTTGEVFTWGLGLLGAVGHGHSVHDELASIAQSSRIVSDGSNPAKALATPTLIRALSGIHVSQVVSSQHTTYAIVAGSRLRQRFVHQEASVGYISRPFQYQRLVFRMGRDAPHANSLQTNGSELNDAEASSSLLPTLMPALTGMPIAQFACSGSTVACLIPTSLTQAEPCLMAVNGTEQTARLWFTGLAITDSGRVPLLRFAVTRRLLPVASMTADSEQAALAMSSGLVMAAQIEGEFVSIESCRVGDENACAIVCAAPDFASSVAEVNSLLPQGGTDLRLPVWVSASLDGGVQWTDPAPLLSVYHNPTNAVRSAPSVLRSSSAASSDNHIPAATRVQLYFQRDDILQLTYECARVRVTLPAERSTDCGREAAERVELPCAVGWSSGVEDHGIACVSFAAPACMVVGEVSVELALDGHNYVLLHTSLRYAAPVVHWIGPAYCYASEGADIVIHTTGLDVDSSANLRVRFVSQDATNGSHETVEAWFVEHIPKAEAEAEPPLETSADESVEAESGGDATATPSADGESTAPADAASDVAAVDAAGGSESVVAMAATGAGDTVPATATNKDGASLSPSVTDASPKVQHTGIVKCRAPASSGDGNGALRLLGVVRVELSIDGGQVFAPAGEISYVPARAQLGSCDPPATAALAGGTTIKVPAINLDPRFTISAVFVVPAQEEPVAAADSRIVAVPRAASVSTEAAAIDGVVATSGDTTAAPLAIEGGNAVSDALLVEAASTPPPALEWVIEVDVPAFPSLTADLPEEQRTVQLRISIDGRIVGDIPVVLA